MHQALLMTLGSSSWNALPESVAFYEQLAGCNYYFVAAFTVSLLQTSLSPTFLIHLAWTLKAYAYDWLLSISDEVEILSRYGLTFPIAIYFVSRISMFLLVTSVVIRLENCEALILIMGVMGVVSAAATMFLFLLRVRAVYMGSRPIVALFGTLWLASVAINIVARMDLRGEHIPSTSFCTATRYKIPELPAIAIFVTDTLVFIAISYRLAADAVTGNSWRSRLRSLVKGEGLYRVSWLLMRTGQLYYLAITLLFVANFVVMTSPFIIVNAAHYALQNTNVGLANIVACRVFRGIALGSLVDAPNGMSSVRITSTLRPEVPPVVAQGFALQAL
ncbi:hypothetical protein HWV62_9385 [Athelia sp. TMB]|nr:hypothetical protein HWV62_9385 [Athelia sp. TMB]